MANDAAASDAPYISDRDLFAYDGFNCHNPSLRVAFEHARNQQYAAAKEAVLEHFKHRRNPLWKNGEQPGEPLTDEERRTVDSFAEQWRNANAEARAEIISKVRQTQGVPLLVRHYHASGDPATAAQLKEVTHWIHDYGLPPPFGCASRARVDLGNFYNPLHGCQWIVEPFGFLSQMQLLLRYDHLDAESMGKYVILVIAAARSRMLHAAGRNCVIMNSLALAQAGIFLPELSDSYWWRRTGMTRALGEFDAIFYPDGGQVEHTAGYNGFSIKLANYVLEFCDWVQDNMETVPAYGENWERSIYAGLPLPREYLWKFRRSLRFYGHTAMPNFAVPPLGDITSGNVGATTTHRVGEMLAAHERFPDDPDIVWISTGGEDGAPPDWTSAAYPCMGYFCMRSGWDANARYCHFEAGPFGEWHGHDDKLSPLIYGYGRLHLRESGYYGGWFGSEHNVLMLDGAPPHRRHGPDTMDLQLAFEPNPVNRWQTTPEFDYAHGVYDDGWAKPDQPGQPWPVPKKLAIWKRSVCFAKPDIFFACDFIAARDNQTHQAAAIFHLSGEDAELAGNCIRTINTGPSRTSGIPVDEPPSTMAMWIVGAGAEQLSLLRRDDDAPAALGVEALSDELSLKPFPVLAVGFTLDQPTALGYVFVPIPPAGDCAVTAASAFEVEATGGAAIGIELELRSGERWTYVQTEPDCQVAVKLDGNHYAADAILVKRQSNGQVESVCEVHGQPFEPVAFGAPRPEAEAWLDQYRCYPER